MNAVRILHTADLHWHPDRQTEALASLQTLYEYAASTRPDLIVMAGDLFDKGVQASDGGGYPALVGAIQRLMDVAPIVTVQGTITHDVPGCYAGLVELNAEHSFTVLDPAHAYYLMDGEVGDYREDELGRLNSASLLIFGCPEPQKSHFLANKSGLGRAEATEAINAGMRQILAGVGARRQELPEVPALMVYHGTVRGSTMCNGQTVPGTDIAVGRDDLALTGCDYVALGHIHQAQEVADCMCYAGSAYPVDWGEVDQKSFYDVTIDTGEEQTTYHRVNYPHPPRRKVVVNAINGNAPGVIDGQAIWLVLRGTAEELADADPEGELAELIAGGADGSSRVTTEVIPTETVRAGEIQEATSLSDKVLVYAQNSTDDPADGVYEKADELEAAAREAGTSGGGLSIWWHTLMLRGATGIHLGMGLEEVSVDLRQYADGLILLAGPNGCGKTTLTELWSPYMELITRSENLQRHFYLKDSYRDLRGTDEATGDEYRSYVQIDPTLASPKAEYFLYRRPAGAEAWVPLTDGRQDSYRAEVTRLFGSIDLYVRSAHTPQIPTRSHPSLAEANRGERRELFSELGGLGYLQAHADAAKERKATAEESVRVDEGKAEVLAGQVAELPGVEAQRCAQQVAHDKHTAVTEELAELGKTLRIEVDALVERVKVQDAKRQELTGTEKRGNELCIEIETAHQAVLEAEKAAESGPKAAEIMQKHADLTTRRGELIDERTEHLKGQAAFDETYRVQMEAFQSESGALQKDALVLESRSGSLLADKAGLVARVDALCAKTETPIDETCPTCGQTLPENMRAILERERAGNVAGLKILQEQVLACDNSITDISQQQQTAQVKLDALEKPEREEIPPWEGEVAMGRVEAEIDGTDIDSARETVTQAQEAAVRIEEGGKRVHDLRNQLQEVEGRMELLRDEIDDELDHLHQAKEGELEDLRERYTEAQKRGAELQMELRGLDERIEGLRESEAALATLREGIAKIRREAAEWAYLQKACGPDGIQALELDAMGPSITEVANQVLSAAGVGEHNHFDAIKIETTRLGGSGSKRKQIEDFLIYCHDTRSEDRWTELGMISVGESVWIRKAIHEAFSAIRVSAGGTKFLLGFLDEADGALDAGIRSHYIDVVQAAHEKSGRRQTILISHSPEVQQAIPQRIEMAELRAPVREASVA